ncbi:nitrate reductase [Bacillus albus]|uniref:phosphotransferase n=1 Tax=Bacillus albus TaxID=2026189 RepID=UPI001009E981|nr:phosphotransferase [Bacillus albus]RXJ20330.1 nitrate reductase [Bacillus albus]RXJ31190.1 nitrate reductase [Bacillus albus]RXJ33857.1 nitrate reductase [Bacillus albus]RXJ42412.1 nitrate reductase [Bacillus albus]RXJ59336.1 nitrate reductase [Bacillus albus]
MLQQLFTSPILSVQTLHPGYDDHASDVFLVRTEDAEVIVRSSKMNEEPNNDFWWGCKNLFGIDPRNVHHLEAVHALLQEYTNLPIPTILEKHILNGREFVVVEKLTGSTVQSFIGQPDSVLISLGKGLAEIHKCNAGYIGNPSCTFQVPLGEFKSHILKVSKELVNMFYSDNESIQNAFPTFESQLSSLPAPKESTLVLIDMDPTQFLSDGTTITGLVDTEAYAVAPREFDFIGLEYVLTEKEARAFKQGYETVMPIPHLVECRRPYRYLHRLLSVQGSVELEKWLSHPAYF